MWRCAHDCRCLQRTGAWYPLELVVNCLRWVLGGELGSSGRAGHALNHLASPPPYYSES